MKADGFEELGITLRNAHGQQRTFCPQCGGKRKNLAVNADEGLYHCHRCGFSGCIGGEASWLDGQLERIKNAQKERDNARNAAVLRALTLWKTTAPCMSHEYLRRKHVLPFGIRQKGDLLIIPMYDADCRLRNCQTIDRTGKKLFLRGGQTSGLYYPISGESKQIYICEGFATGATMHQVFYKNARIAVAFNAGNLINVAKALREKHPGTPLVIAADNDQWTDGNPGMAKAKAAADAVGAKVVYPKFEGYDVSGKPTDFNDLYLLRRDAIV